MCQYSTYIHGPSGHRQRPETPNVGTKLRPGETAMVRVSVWWSTSTALWDYVLLCSTTITGLTFAIITLQTVTAHTGDGFTAPTFTGSGDALTITNASWPTDGTMHIDISKTTLAEVA